MSKLTLNVDDDLIAAAKKEAAKRETSVSKMVSDYLRVITTEERTVDSRMFDSDRAPITESLVGILKSADLTGDPRLEYLMEKYS